MLPSLSIHEALHQRALLTPDHVLIATDDGELLTAQELEQRVRELAATLSLAGVGVNSRVVTVLNNDVGYVVLFLALCVVDAVWIPVNPQTRGPALIHILKTAKPNLVIAESELVGTIAAATSPEIIHTRDFLCGDGVDVESTVDAEFPSASADPHRLRCVMFTSGTTGPPKGVMVTERMLIASGVATGLASRQASGDVYLFWEPLYHIGGAQLVVLALLEEIRLTLVSKFSASQFWRQVHQHGVTKLHYLGGVLDILLAQPQTSLEANHPIALGFGGGARMATWSAFSDRFGIDLNEVYGMTEASSFSTLNDGGPPGSIGKALPWFGATLCDETGAEVHVGEIGELVLDDKGAGLITPGYLDDVSATDELIRNGQLWTGDLMRRDDEDYFWFVGRRRDFIRRRGENVSAWEVEQVLNEHPAIVDSAAIGVDSTIGEQDIHAYIEIDGDVSLDAIYKWCQSKLGRHQIPRLWSVVPVFARTPSQRIIKDRLANEGYAVWDADQMDSIK